MEKLYFDKTEYIREKFTTKMEKLLKSYTKDKRILKENIKGDRLSYMVEIGITEDIIDAHIFMCKAARDALQSTIDHAQYDKVCRNDEERIALSDKRRAKRLKEEEKFTAWIAEQNERVKTLIAEQNKRAKKGTK